MDRPVCETCAYFEPPAASADKGECHEDSPDAVQIQDYATPSQQTVWPPVGPGQWCGRHPLFKDYVRSLYPSMSGISQPKAAGAKPAEAEAGAKR